MESEAIRVGTRVRVRSDYEEPSRERSVGTIQKRHGTPDYTAFEVLFSDGHTELLWDHQLEEVVEPAHRSKKRRWPFW
jgi:hypothetical protein